MYNHFRYARRIDADNIGLYHNDMTKLLNLDKGTADQIIMSGGLATTKSLKIKGTVADTYPYILLTGNGRIQIVDNSQLDINQGATLLYRLIGGAVHMKEMSTPTAIADFGSLYTKNTNEVFFQDGAGVEHKLAYA